MSRSASSAPAESALPAPAESPIRGLPGLALLFGGALLAGVSFAVLPWYSVTGGVDSAGDGFTFADLHANADSLGAPVAAAYFDKAAWGLLGLVVLFGIAARILVAVSAPLRVVGFLVGAAGIALTWYALAQLFNAQQIAGGSSHSVVHSSSWGLWFAVLGYLLAAVGAVLPPPVPPRPGPVRTSGERRPDAAAVDAQR